MQAGLRFATLLGLGSWPRAGHVGMPYNTLFGSLFIRLVRSTLVGTLACLLTFFWIMN